MKIQKIHKYIKTIPIFLPISRDNKNVCIYTTKNPLGLASLASLHQQQSSGGAYII